MRNATRSNEDLAAFEQYRLRLRKMRTHHFRAGDESIQRMLEIGFKATGLIGAK